MTIDLKNFRDKKILRENEKDDIEKIEIRNYDDIIRTIHYLADYLGKYLFANDIMDFDRIYYKSKKNLKLKRVN
jgi:hypothetical protein